MKNTAENHFLDDLFEQSRLQPTVPAVVDQDGTRVTDYAEFASLIRKTTAKILQASLPEQSFIVINMGRCREYLAAFAAVICAGHAVIPLVPETPSEREAYIMREAECPLRITEEFFEGIDAWPEADMVKREEDSTALMLYTSGSTGRPKGVYLSFGVISRRFQQFAVMLEGISPIRYASSVAYSFAAISVDTFHVFCAGGTMHILSDEVRKDVFLMNEYYRRHQITTGNVHPRFHKYLDGGDQLKRIFTSGHRITDFYSDRFETVLGYGLAETFSVCTYFKLDKAYKTTPVGKEYGGYRVFISDEEGNELPDGTTGEVRVSGDLAFGYYHMPELTAETFERRRDGTVLLHTHDIGYKDENGDLVLINRNDWMVKINGMSVNPAEIDYAMNSIPGIRESAAKGFTDQNGNQYLCTFYVTEDDTLTPEVLKQALAGQLMPYMIPSVFERMDRLPQTISAKVDYAALKAPEREAEETVYEAPENETEQKICDTFCRVLNLQKAGRNSDFFALGGNSLSVVELIAVLNDSQLRVSDVMTARTPANIAQKMKTVSSMIKEQKIVCLTPYQQRYLQLCTAAYPARMGNSARCLKFNRSSVTPEQLADAMASVMAAHPAFRTRIHQNSEGQPVQFLSSEEPEKPEIRSVKDAELEDVLEGFSKPFVLYENPLYRTAVLVTETGLFLYFDIHHIISDAASVSFIIRDLLGCLHGKNPEPDRYPLYLSLMNEAAERGEFRTLQNRLRKEYSTDWYHRHPVFDSEERGFHSSWIRYDTEIHSENLRLCSDHRNPGIQTALNACVLSAMRDDCGNDRVLISWLSSGRDTAMKQNMAGLLVSALPSPVDFSSIHSPEELLDSVRDSGERWLKETDASPSSLMSGPFEQDILTVNYFRSDSGDSGTGTDPLLEETRSLLGKNTANTCIFYVILNELDEHHGILWFQYNDTLYREEHIRRFIGYFKEAVKQLSLEGTSWLTMEEH